MARLLRRVVQLCQETHCRTLPTGVLVHQLVGITGTNGSLGAVPRISVFLGGPLHSSPVRVSTPGAGNLSRHAASIPIAALATRLGGQGVGEEESVL